MAAMRIQAALVASAIVLSGCTSLGMNRTAETAGMQAGSALQQETTAASTAAAAAILAAMNGGLIGGSIGSALDEGDKRRGVEAEYQALEYTPSGQPVTWRNDSAGRYGEVVAAQPYRVGSQDCRQYNHTVFVDTRPQTARGTACRNADGSWTPLT